MAIQEKAEKWWLHDNVKQAVNTPQKDPNSRLRENVFDEFWINSWVFFCHPK